MKSNYSVRIIFLLTIFILTTTVVSASNVITLEEVLNLGLENNTGLKASTFDRNKSEIDYDSAKKAFYPEINIDTSYTRMFLDDEKSSSSGGSIPTPESTFDYVLLNNMMDLMSAMQPDEDNYQTGISIQQPIFLGGKLWLGLKQAKTGLEVADVQVEQKKNELVMNIIQSYYNVLLAQERVQIEEDALELVREHKRAAQASYDAGVTLKTDLLQVEIEEGKALHSLKSARNDLLMAKKMLGNTIGTDIEDMEFKSPMLKPEMKLDLDYQYEIAKSNRTELELLSLNKEILETNLKMEKNSHLPNIVLSGNYQWQGQEISLDDGTGSITLAASINIFDKGLSRNKQDKIDQDLKKAVINEDNLEEMIRLEIEDLLLTINEDKNNMELQEMNLKKAEENLELETKRYKVGMGTNVNVMNAQVLLKQTKISKTQSEYQYKINIFKLLQKTGQLIDYCQEVLINE